MGIRMKIGYRSANVIYKCDSRVILAEESCASRESRARCGTGCSRLEMALGWDRQRGGPVPVSRRVWGCEVVLAALARLLFSAHQINPSYCSVSKPDS